MRFRQFVTKPGDLCTPKKVPETRRGRFDRERPRTTFASFEKVCIRGRLVFQ